MKSGRKIAVSQSSKAGLPPGTLQHVGERDPEPTNVRVFVYGPDFAEEKNPECLEELFRIRDSNIWINVSGLFNLEEIKRIGVLLRLHPLTLEDILNTNQRPKYEEFDDYIFLVLKNIRNNGVYNNFNDSVKNENNNGAAINYFSGDLLRQDNSISSGQVSIILGEGVVCSFEEAGSDLFDSIVKRLFDSKSRIRKYGSDYLMYALTDCIVDRYFAVFENIGEYIEDLEGRIIEEGDDGVMEEIYALKRNLLFIRKQIWPVREAVSGIIRNQPELISEKIIVYLNDVSDHLHQLNDILESYREMSTGFYEIYLSTLSNRMNEVMKVLTIIATIFIPLTFIAGIYGMNFVYMPELAWEHGYPSAIIVMLGTALLMLVYFRKKKWI
ncbi:magnesium/cobalt transporter CorA [Methanoplanus limicola]|uniref:Magnesium transport protein CorA n=1 Tax=Methanoplanus limicola DSM 2279 TaxID=937775 RepID=H1Z337_9EURY|nr:magnesium/cobalt transporter CorA [Methanoplanus limicola]EHQ35577.1 magnesium and cobalt transport protein CorA [Methanoplanus limicola DSM 2279]